MLKDTRPYRRASADSHIPPPWVSTEAVFFLTINCQQRGHAQLTAADTPTAILDSISFLHERKSWYPEMVLLMPDHLHMLVAFPWNEKLGMNHVISQWKRFIASSLSIKWQRDFFDHRIRSDQDHQSTWFYIRENPVRAGLVETYDQWPHVWFPHGTGWPQAGTVSPSGPA
jgi:putative transposase